MARAWAIRGMAALEQNSCNAGAECSFQATFSPLNRSVPVAYLFARFPSFSQTFCYREVAEIIRQGETPPVFSLRKPEEEPAQDWEKQIVDRVQYLPDQAQLTREIDDRLKRNKLPKAIVDLVAEWGRRPDFLRLYQAIHIGLRLQQTGINRVHAHFAGMAARTAFWVQKFFGISFSFTAHANDIFAPHEFEIGLGKLFEAASRVITVSDYTANFLKERFPQNAGKIQRIYNGLDLSKFRRADFVGPIATIVSIGRLIDKKGFADLIRACALLEKRGRNFRCEIIGEGPLKDELRALIDELDLQSCVSLTGPKTQSEIIERLAAASIFVLPSIVDSAGARDNLPTVIMEAMAAGLPVVSTLVGGIPEMVVPDETGFLVRSGDAMALADAIERVLVDLALAKKLGQTGYERAANLFSIEKNVRELRGLL
jgi:glycosyltransferase involved in cell wall biosynthesis